MSAFTFPTPMNHINATVPHPSQYPYQYARQQSESMYPGLWPTFHWGFPFTPSIVRQSGTEFLNVMTEPIYNFDLVAEYSTTPDPFIPIEGRMACRFNRDADVWRRAESPLGTNPDPPFTLVAVVHMDSTGLSSWSYYSMFGFSQFASDNVGYGFTMYTYNNGSGERAYQFRCPTGTACEVIPPGDAAADWYLLAGVVKSYTDRTLYGINLSDLSVQTDTETDSTSGSFTFNAISFGALPSWSLYGNNMLNGWVSSASIYRRALSVSQVYALACNPACPFMKVPTPDGLVMYEEDEAEPTPRVFFFRRIRAA